MAPLPEHARLAEEAAVMLTLLDAAATSGCMSQTVRIRWERLQSVDAAEQARVAGSFYEMLTELEQEGALENSWIGEHWAALRLRVTKSV